MAIALNTARAAGRLTSFRFLLVGRSAPALFSTVAEKRRASQTVPENEIKKSVFISQSNDVFSNLALEDWVYRNMDLTKHHILFLWRNSPTVVVGRHQNPWLEANTQVLNDCGVEIARRNSGGGTVFHDAGNLNLTFFTARDVYNRRRNLDTVSRALFREFNLFSEVNSREDIIVNGNKVSGTASKLGNPNAYHHCTVLVDVDKSVLRNALYKYDKGIHTNATPSIPSPVTNLRDVNPHISVETLQKAVGWEFLRTTALTMEDGGMNLASKQCGFQLVNPSEDWFPGLDKIREEFVSWAWRFGKTPKFSVSRTFPVPDSLVQKAGISTVASEQELGICLDVSKGIIEDVTLKIPPSMMSAKGFTGDAEVLTSLRGKRFCESAIEILENCLGQSLSGLSGHEELLNQDGAHDTEEEKFVANCMRQTMMAV